jgi:deoxyribonuclease V
LNLVPHSWSLSPEEAVELQRSLAARVRIEPLSLRPKIIGAEDISYSRQSDLLFAVFVTFTWPGLELIETAGHVCKASFPYVPGLLSFREVPPLLEAFSKLNQKPDVLLCDAQGIAHPRRLGLASHLGIWLGIPSVGCAKSRLCGSHADPLIKKGSSKPLFLKEEQVGIVLRSREGVKPIYISPGHLCDLKTSKKLVDRCLGRYRIPEPLRRAHIEANRLRVETERVL